MRNNSQPQSVFRIGGHLPFTEVPFMVKIVDILDILMQSFYFFHFPCLPLFVSPVLFPIFFSFLDFKGDTVVT